MTLAQNSNGAGSFLTVTGTNFSAATAVTVGGEPAVFLVNSPTTIVAVVPAGLSGTASVAVSTPNGISAVNSVSQVSLAITPVPNSSGTLPNPTGNPYVVSGNALPAVGSGSFGGTTGPATIPTAPIVPTNHPVATTTLTFPNGTNHTPVLAVTVVDSGASAYDTINTVTQSDGSILVTEQTGSTSFTFASSSNGLSGTAAASSLDVTRQMISTISVTLIAANNTGYTRFNACLTNQSWHSTTSNSVTRFSTDTHTTSVNSDQEQGLASLDGIGQKRVTLVTNSNLDDASNGTILATGIASGQFQHATNSSDNFRNDDANNTPADLKNSRMNGSDTANSTSLGTFTLNPDGTRIVADTYTGSSSGNDNYTGSETRTSTTVTPSATGSTTLYDRMVVNDSGFDEYQFSGFGTLAVAVDGTVSSVDNHTDNDDGNEERIVADAGWIQSDYTLPDGTILSTHDDFSDQNDDQSRYDDGDQLAANTTTGGTDTPTSNFRETDPFQTNDQSTIRLTSVNAYGTPTISIITNKLTDQGQLSDRSQYRDQETLGAGEVDLEEDISFDNHSEEEDTATSDLKIVITTRGQVGVGEFLDSIETLTWKDTTPSTDTYRDVGTDNVTPTHEAEADYATDRVTHRSRIQREDQIVSTNIKTLADGTIITDIVNTDDTDEILDNELDQTGDNHTDNIHTDNIGANGANEQINDDDTVNDQFQESDQYAEDDTSTESIVIPIPGGTLTISHGRHLVDAGTAGDQEGVIGEENTANAAVDGETDTSDQTNIDEGTETDSDSLNLIVTDPVTGVVTKIIGSDDNVDNFSDDDGIRVTDTTSPTTNTNAGSSAGSSTATSETDTSHAIANDRFTDTRNLLVSVQGNPSAGLTIDFVNNLGSIDKGVNTDDEELPSLVNGTGTETDQFSSSDTLKLTESGHSNLHFVVNTDDGHGNTVNINESDNKTFGLSSPGTITNSDSGQEIVVEASGKLTSDTEGDTDTQGGEVDPFSNETTNANDKTVTVDPRTGLQTTIIYKDNGSTDNVQEQDTERLTDTHSASLTNFGSDVDSGNVGVTDNEQSITDVSNEIDLVGPESADQIVNLVNKYILQGNSQDTKSVSDLLATTGTNTDTTSLTGSLSVTDLYYSLSGTISTRNASTGLTTTDAIADVVESNGTDTFADSDTKVIPVSGNTTDSRVKGDAGQSQEHWSFMDITSQISATNTSVGNVITNGDNGTDSQAELNGTETDQGNSETSASTTTPATSTPPDAPPVAPPGSLDSAAVYHQDTLHMGAAASAVNAAPNPKPTPPANPDRGAGYFWEWDWSSFGSGYCRNVNPWSSNAQPPVDGIDKFLVGSQKAAIVTGGVCGVGAASLGAAVVIGVPGAATIATSEISVAAIATPVVNHTLPAINQTLNVCMAHSEVFFAGATGTLVTVITYGEGATFEESLVAGGFSGSLQYLAAGGPLRFPKISGFSQGTSANRPLITTRSATSTPNLTSGRTHGVTNADRVVKDAPRTPPLANVLEGHSAQQGFTGVIDSSTGKVLIRPSTAASDVPAGWVARRGGHADVSSALGGNAASHRGFAVILQEDGSLAVTWRSGVLNSPPDYVVPLEMRQSIVNAIEAATGRKVSSF